MAPIPGSSITFGVVSEIHCTPPGEPNVSWHNELRFDLGLSLLKSSLASFSTAAVDAIAVLGDLTNVADRESMHRVRRMLRATGKPVIALSGNHDITADLGSANDFQQFFTDEFTCTPPLATAFGGHAVRLLGLTRSPETNALTSLGAPLSASDDLAIVMSHYPLLPLTETLHDAGLKHAGDITDLVVRSSELAGMTGPTIVLHGHLHVRATTVAGSVLHLSFAALVEPPHECSTLTLSGTPEGGYFVERRAASVQPYAVDRIPVLVPDRERWSWDGVSWQSEPV